MNVSLTKYQREYIKAKVKSGGYKDASEVIREALRVLEELELDREAIEQALDEADLEPAEAVGDLKEYFRKLKTELHQERAKRRAAA